MGRKKGGGDKAEQSPRRGMRRSIRYDAQEEWPEDRMPEPDPEMPPAIQLRKLRAEVALDRLKTQVQLYLRQGRKEVLIVHGKGQNSPGGVSVLGPLVRQWCDAHPRIVLSWRISPTRWGGEGAIVATLRCD